MWSRVRVPEIMRTRREARGWATPALAVILTLGGASCGQPGVEQGSPETPALASQAASLPEGQVEVPPPPFSPGIYPCSNCHSMIPVNTTRRVLTGFHTNIVLQHDEGNRWCLDCHDAENRDQLHLASGEPVQFEESYRLCGQCHGEKYRDWRAGVHGRRSGDWNGHKSYLLCAHCHNPHKPHFQPLQPEPAPIPPRETVGGLER